MARMASPHLLPSPRKEGKGLGKGTLWEAWRWYLLGYFVSLWAPTQLDHPKAKSTLCPAPAPAPKVCSAHKEKAEPRRSDDLPPQQQGEGRPSGQAGMWL